MIELAGTRRSMIATLILAALASGNCMASEADIPELAILQDLPVVLSASRLRQPLSETPNAVTVIDRAMIEASGFRTVPELFKLVPGMYFDYSDGFEPLIGYRGATDAYPRRMQVLVDGRSIYMPPFSVVAWGDLPLDVGDVERIEVVRGPAATSYGSNSILGVINIITREAYSVRGASVTVNKGTGGDGNGISDLIARMGKRTERFDYRLSMGKRGDNGLHFPAGFHNVFDGYNDNNVLRFANMRGNYHPGSVNSLDIQLGYSEGVRATGNPERDISQPRNVLTSSGFQQINWLHAIGPYDDLQVQYYHQSYSAVDHSTSLPILGIPYPLNEDIRADRHELEVQHRFQMNSRNRVVWGAALRYDSSEAAFLFTNREAVRQSRLFAHDEWRITSPLLMNAGAMLEDDGMGNRKASPKLALNYHVTPTNTLRASVSVAYRNPALAEQYSRKTYTLGSLFFLDWLSSGRLRPERALSREIGYIGQISDGLSIDARAYSDQVSDIIWIFPTLGASHGAMNDVTWDFRNEMNARYTGIESTLKYRFADNNVTLNYAYQHASATVFETPNSVFLQAFLQAGVDFPRTVPLNSVSVLWDRQLSSNWSCSFGYYQQSTVTVLEGIDSQPLSRRTDVRIARKFGRKASEPDDKGGEIAVVLQNAFQDPNLGYSGYTFVRRLYMTGTLNF
jgi:iron complex outermembrane receptor protein